MREEKQKSGRPAKRVFLTVICCILALVLAALIGLTVWVKVFLSDIDRIDNSEPTLSPEEISSILSQTDAPDPDFTGPVLNEQDVTMPSGPAAIIESGENIINFLLVGQDRRPGDPRMHSDAMILVTINKSAKTLTMTSFMRDLWVQIPGYYKQRLNVPYMVDPTNGFNLLNETLEYNFGVSAEHNLEVDFSGFTAAIEAVGGVEINLTAAEASYLNSLHSWGLQEGVSLLNGEQALTYSRIRKIGDDFARTSRQRTVLMALVDKAKTLNLTELYNLTKSILPMLATDMTDSEIIGYVMELAPLLPELTIVSQRIPADGAYYNAWINDCLVLCQSEDDWATNLQILEDTIAVK